MTVLDRIVEQEQQGRTLRDVVELLDGIEGACGRMELGRCAAAEGRVVPLDQV